VYSYYDRTVGQCRESAWTKSGRNAARRGAVESLIEERLQYGADKCRKGLFEEMCVDEEEDLARVNQNWKSKSPDRWDTIGTGKWMQKAV